MYNIILFPFYTKVSKQYVLLCTLQLLYLEELSVSVNKNLFHLVFHG